VIRETRRVLAHEGPAGLRVDDLVREDLPLLGWSGGSAHLASVGRALDRVESGEVEYLVVRAPSGYPIAKGVIDFAIKPSTGTLSQLVTADGLRGLGIGAHLIAVAEARMRDRRVCAAELGVEDDNHLARGPFTNVSLPRSRTRIRGVERRRSRREADPLRDRTRSAPQEALAATPRAIRNNSGSSHVQSSRGGHLLPADWEAQR
jgi:GNAT superfamily N-acetyltransferase